jgi:hypothetical protein
MMDMDGLGIENWSSAEIAKRYFGRGCSKALRPPHLTAERNFHATHGARTSCTGQHLKLDLTFDIRPK